VIKSVRLIYTFSAVSENNVVNVVVVNVDVVIVIVDVDVG